MSVVATKTCAPSVIESGATYHFTVSNSCYPATGWTMQFALNNGIDAPLLVTATPDSSPGTGFTVTLTAVQTAALATGRYTWGEVFTSIATPTEKAVGLDGLLNVLPGVTATAKPSEAQAMVALLLGGLQALAAATEKTVSFNGQSFSRDNVSEYRKELVYWQSRVISEQKKIDALRGIRTGGEIGVTFDRPRATLGLYPASWPH